MNIYKLFVLANFECDITQLDISVNLMQLLICGCCVTVQYCNVYGRKGATVYIMQIKQDFCPEWTLLLRECVKFITI